MGKKAINTALPDVLVASLEFGDREFSGGQHVHSEMQILAGKSGMLEVKVVSKKINLRVGDVLIIKSSVPHTAKPILPFTATASIKINKKVLIPASLSEVGEYLYDALSHFDRDFLYLRREDETTGDFFSNIARISEENEKKDKSASLFVEGYSKILLGLLERGGLLESRIRGLDENAASKIFPALLFVKENYTKEISLEEIAKTLDMNREYFCRLFKKTVGITFVDYVNLVRISQAKRLLISSQKTIVEISSELGFSSVSYFTRVFKNITNSTPAIYRNIAIF